MKFDIYKQEWEYYNKLLNAPNLTLEEWGIRGEIVEITAEYYISEIARITRTTPKAHMRVLKGEKGDRKTIEFLKTLDTPIAIPVINYTCGAQEGRHRAIAFSELHGEDAKFPCLIVMWIDENKRGFTFWNWLDYRRKKHEEKQKMREVTHG